MCIYVCTYTHTAPPFVKNSFQEENVESQKNFKNKKGVLTLLIAYVILNMSIGTHV